MRVHSIRLILIGVLLPLFILSLGWFLYGNVQAGMNPGDVIASAALLSVPLGLLYFSIGLLVVAWRQHRQGRVREQTAR